ncbi:MAG: acyltransferase family protein [Marinicella sp.]
MINRGIHEENRYRLDIQGMRAIAVLLVFFGHVGLSFIEGGFVGVDVFFVISGYVITQLILLEYQRTQQFNFLRFYVNRLKRLMPAMVLMIAVVLLVLYWLMDLFVFSKQLNGAISASAWVSNLFFLIQNQDYFSKQDAVENFFLHTWSLGIEEQFYLIWPMLLVFLLAHKQFKNNFIVCIWVLVVLSLILHFSISLNSDLVSFYLMPTRFWQFALGGVIAYIKVTKSYNLTGKNGLNELAYLSGLLLIFGAALILNSSYRYPYWFVIMPTFGTLLVLLAYGGGDTIGGKFLSSKYLVWMGDLSYSFYLWHWPVILLIDQFVIIDAFLRVGLAFVITILCSILSYYLLENPLRKFKSKRPYQEQMVLLIAFMVIFCSLLFSFGKLSQDRGITNDNVYQKAIKDIPPIYTYGCDTWYKSEELTQCVFGDKDSEKTAVLLGDSILAQWFSLVARKYTQDGWKLIVLTKSSCPIVDESFYYERIKSNYKVCDVWRESALDYISQISPDVLIMGSANTYPFDESQWKSGTSRIIERMDGLPTEIKLIAGTPGLTFNGPHV